MASRVIRPAVIPSCPNDVLHSTLRTYSVKMANVSEHRQFSWRNFRLCCLLSVGMIAYGYPASIIGTTLAQPAFLRYMRLIDENGDTTPESARLIGATSGVFQAGAVFGVLIGGWVTDKYGRRAGLVYCATLSIFGGVFLCAAQNIAMFIVFRFIAGAGAWAYIVTSESSNQQQCCH